MSPDDHAYPPVGRAKQHEAGTTTVPSVCPHDCTSTCALDVERLSNTKIGRVRGSMRNDYTAGVICEKVARYAERIHHPDRLMKPMRRVGPKGSKQFAEISWTDALDIVAEQFIAKARQHGSETIWPYYYAGTMGLVQRDGINRLRHAMKYSRWFSTICVTLSDTGWIAGVGAKRGADVREIDAHSELVVIWGGNPVNTQVNVMTHAMKAKKLREALQQMAEEGVVQLFLPHDGAPAIVGVVGALQLDVLKERMDAEYSLPVDFEPCQFSIARWVSSDDKAALQKFVSLKPSSMADDLDGDPVFMASSQFTLKYDAERAPEVIFSDVKDYQKVASG